MNFKNVHKVIMLTSCICTFSALTIYSSLAQERTVDIIQVEKQPRAGIGYQVTPEGSKGVIGMQAGENVDYEKFVLPAQITFLTGDLADAKVKVSGPVVRENYLAIKNADQFKEFYGGLQSPDFSKSQVIVFDAGWKNIGNSINIEGVKLIDGVLVVYYSIKATPSKMIKSQAGKDHLAYAVKVNIPASKVSGYSIVKLSAPETAGIGFESK